MKYTRGMWYKDDYFLPPLMDESSGQFTVTITKMVKDGALVDIIYGNDPEYDRHDVFRNTIVLHDDRWNEPVVYLPEELFTL
jgi:hypothetical protein